MTLTATGLAGSALCLIKFCHPIAAEALIGMRPGRDHQHRIRLSGMEISQRLLVDEPQRGERHRPA